MTIFVCTRCGYARSLTGTLITEDGYELTADQYLDLLSLVGGELVCELCARPDDERLGGVGPG